MRQVTAALFALLALAPVGSSAQNSQVARQLLSSDTLGIGSATVSPDGKWLVFVNVLSEQGTRMMIRPMTGGPVRVLFSERGMHFAPKFTPHGDRILFVSTLPQRGAADEHNYLVSVPFDAAKGVVTAPVRQISLEGLSVGPLQGPVMSPDGAWVAYRACCGAPIIKIVPVTGGNARVLVEKSDPRGVFGWSTDGKSLLYMSREGQEFVRRRVSREGGPSEVVARSPEPLGVLSSDGRFSYISAGGSGASPWLVRFFTPDGKRMGEVEVPNGLRTSGMTADGKYIIGLRSNAVAPIKLAPTAGGPIKTLTTGDVYDWALSWTGGADTVYVATVDQGLDAILPVSRDGAKGSVFRVEKPTRLMNSSLGIEQGVVVYSEPLAGSRSSFRLLATRLADHSTKELATGIVGRSGVTGPGGMYYGLYQGEAYYGQLKGDRLAIRAVKLDGQSRLVGEVPASVLGNGSISSSGTQLLYEDRAHAPGKLMLAGAAGKPDRVFASFANSGGGDFVFSSDGRQLAVSRDGISDTLFIYRVGADGMPEGAPRAFKLPFSYWYEMFWLPDGSGVTMIAQPKGAERTEVALVKLSDPEHPLLLTRDDPVSKWGYSLSPDGKWVAYPSERLRGSSVYLIDVAEALKQMKGQP